MTDKTVKLEGQIRISGLLKTCTGLHIGGTQVGLEIGGTDNTIVRNGLDGRPYIPGSSLKGKMRGLLDRVYTGDRLVDVIRSDKQPIRIHVCDDADKYQRCFLCNIFGITPEKAGGECLPTRLIVRDAMLENQSAEKLEKSLYVDMPFTQVKTEVVIDRITSAATPRQMERVPAGVHFSYEMVYNVYEDKDIEWLDKVLEAMDLLEHDYLGGQGSRGYGQVRFDTRSIEIRSFNGRKLADDPRIQEWKNKAARAAGESQA